MYNIGGWLNLLSPRGLRGVQAGVSRNVLMLGLTSLFTDISSEMVVSVLPIYLVTFLRLSPVQFGLIDGLYQGVAALVQLAGGVIADRWRRHKEVAWVGYAGSAVSRLGLLATTAWTGIAGFLVIDRLGKGLRTAPRDALISLSVPKERARHGVWRPPRDGCDGRDARTDSRLRHSHRASRALRRGLRDELSRRADRPGSPRALCREPFHRSARSRL